ncbi:hypothetical protein IBTHAUMO2_990054 [Nitrosopumilaceae archaeon]|nr:hypothetical protein IBTHAUMO2_990054 [Nitrosopumilaceae archaeon]
MPDHLRAVRAGAIRSSRSNLADPGANISIPGFGNMRGIPRGVTGWRRPEDSNFRPSD